MADAAESGPTFRGYAVLVWAIEEVDRIDDLAELARTIREYYAGDPRLSGLLRKIDERAEDLRPKPWRINFGDGTHRAGPSPRRNGGEGQGGNE